MTLKYREPAMAMSGMLTDYSTRDLHSHSVHQILVINDGVSLLMDEQKSQPLYGSMCAFLPAKLTHKSVVIGEQVSYKSLYIVCDMIPFAPGEIVIYEMSGLGKSLFDRLISNKPRNFSCGIMRDILDLFIKVTQEDLNGARFNYRLPQSKSGECKIITEFIEKNYMKKIEMADFKSVLPYSERHISRLFKAEMKITIFEYVRLYRIFMSSVMLHGDNSILRISIDCGYESLSVFYSDFRKYFNITPTDFRRKVLG